ncbi:hypothetical protein RFI_40067, partial [Reticulomyxa filosa]
DQSKKKKKKKGYKKKKKKKKVCEKQTYCEIRCLLAYYAIVRLRLSDHTDRQSARQYNMSRSASVIGVAGVVVVVVTVVSFSFEEDNDIFKKFFVVYFSRQFLKNIPKQSKPVVCSIYLFFSCCGDTFAFFVKLFIFNNFFEQSKLPSLGEKRLLAQQTVVSLLLTTPVKRKKVHFQEKDYDVSNESFYLCECLYNNIFSAKIKQKNRNKQHKKKKGISSGGYMAVQYHVAFSKSAFIFSPKKKKSFVSKQIIVTKKKKKKKQEGEEKRTF